MEANTQYRTEERGRFVRQYPNATPHEIDAALVLEELLRFHSLSEAQRLVELHDPCLRVTLPKLFGLAVVVHSGLSTGHWLKSRYPATLVARSYADFEDYYRRNRSFFETEEIEPVDQPKGEKVHPITLEWMVA